jgi:hypothetical protein
MMKMKVFGHRQAISDGRVYPNCWFPVLEKIQTTSGFLERTGSSGLNLHKTIILHLTLSPCVPQEELECMKT